MSCDWPEVPFPDVIDFKEGPGILARDFHDDGVPLIRVAGLSGSGSVLRGCNFVSPEKVEAKWSHFKIRRGDTLLSTSASLGRVAVVGSDAEGAIPYTGIIRMRPRNSKVVAPFMPHLLRSPHFQHQAEAMGSGSVLKHFGPSHLRMMTVILPPVDEQRRIAWVLGSLDDKIENNRRIAKTLEEITAALFKARFVDFVDHDDLVESEIGPVPRGWAVRPLRQLATVTMGQSPPSTTYSEDSSVGPVMVQGKGAFGLRFPKAETFCSAPTRVASPDDLLMTVRAPVGELNICTEKTCLGRGVAGIASPHPSFIEFSLRCGAERWRAREGGTIYPSVNKRQVEEFPLVIPPDEAIHEFEEVAQPIRSVIAACHRERSTLAALRDALLPRLISGQIRVPATGSEDSPA